MVQHDVIRLGQESGVPAAYVRIVEDDLEQMGRQNRRTRSAA